MNLSEINIREKDFHNKLQSQKRGRFENIFYKALYNISEDFFDYLKNNANNAEILDYGCGVGSFVEEVAKFGPKKIVGIDISEVSINKAVERTKELKTDVNFIVDNCEKTKFANNSFDIVYGSGILHHLQINKCLDEIHRVLKSNGSLVFIEPLGTNPIINFYRKLTPKSRSDDEHPFNFRDIKLIKKIFGDVEVDYYGFLTLVFFPFYKNPKNSKFFKFISFLDKLFLKIKFFNFLAWSILIKAKKI